MLNKEYYRDLLVEFAISNDKVALNAEGVPIACNDTCCAKCGFDDRCVDDCDKVRKRWANTEYTEPRIHWEDVPVDTPVYLNYDSRKDIPAHFASYDAELNKITVFDEGRTSFTISSKHDIEHDVSGYLSLYVTLAKEEDKKKYYHR